jgi:hypothetical protein
MLYVTFNPLEPRTRREIVIEDFHGLGKVVIPKGTWVRVRAEGGNTEGTSILVDACVRGESTFYGVRIDANDIEPPLSP